MQLSCVIAPTPASRRTKAQLQREIEGFRRRAEQLDLDEDNDSRSDSPTVGRGNARLSGVDAIDGAPAPISFTAADPIPAPVLVPALTSASDNVVAGLQPEASPSISKTSESHPSSIGHDQTIGSPISSQVFDGQEVTGRKIQNCFNLYRSPTVKLLISY
ncbi:hypothetical protein ACHAQJ_009768 [Trichoderma viride]